MSGERGKAWEETKGREGSGFMTYRDEHGLYKGEIPKPWKGKHVCGGEW